MGRKETRSSDPFFSDSIFFCMIIITWMDSWLIFDIFSLPFVNSSFFLSLSEGELINRFELNRHKRFDQCGADSLLSDTKKKERERDGQRVCVRALGYWEQRKGEEDGREILIRLWWFLTDDRRDQPSANGSKSLSTNRATPALLSPLCICALSYAYLCETACVSLSLPFFFIMERANGVDDAASAVE